jgi:hypothetical protein
VDAVMLGASVLIVVLLGAEQEQDLRPLPLPARQAHALLDRLMVTEPYVGSAEEREAKGSTGRHFSRGEYARLRGNPLLGYWDAGTFAWTGGEKLAWDGIRTAHRSARPITMRAWDAAIRQVARRQGLTLSMNAEVRLEGACVAAVIDSTEREPVAGVLLEVRLKSPGGVLLYRLGVGKATVEDAIGAALDVVVRFSRSLMTASNGGPSGPAR